MHISFLKLAVSVCLVSACSLSAFAGESPAEEITAPYDFAWEPLLQAKQQGDISTYIYDVPDKALHAFKGEAAMPYSILNIIAMLMDVDAMPEWIYKLERVDKQQGLDNPDSLYMAFSAIWPVKARDVGVRSYVKYDLHTGVVEMYSQNSDAVFPPTEDYVRIPYLYNRWRLSPLPERGWTAVEFEAFVDVGGRLPSWLINMVSKNTPKKTLEGMQQQMASGRYNIKSVSELPFVPPGLEGYKSEK